MATQPEAARASPSAPADSPALNMVALNIAVLSTPLRHPRMCRLPVDGGVFTRRIATLWVAVPLSQRRLFTL
ncbi:MAG: hypothetical protein QM667_09435 [Asticcacaulis sp.]